MTFKATDIQFKPVRYNFTSAVNKPVYIVIHDTGNPTASALNHFNYFNGGDRGASAHYFVDPQDVVQIIKDTDSAWHCGDGYGKYGITNRNSIGIEMCLNGDRAVTIRKTIELTAYLMQKHNIPAERVVRHYDASRKNCPAILSANNWTKWVEFKVQLQRVITESKEGNGMTESQIRALIQQEVKQAVRQSEYDTSGQVDSHWAEKPFQNLQSKGITFHDRRFNDLATRGEVFQMLSNVVDQLKG